MVHLGWPPLARALAGASRVLLTGPTAPDGDSIGACLALQRVLASRGVTTEVAGDPGYRYRFLPGAAAMLPDQSVPRGTFDAVVVLDGDRHRLAAPVRAAFEAAPIRGIIDHHASTRTDGYTHAWVDGGATSTCEMLYDAWTAEGVPLDVPLAELLYVGAIFDTGGFRYSNTTPSTHRMAAHLLEIGIDHAYLNARVLMMRRPQGLRVAAEVFRNATFHLADQILVGEVSRDLATRLDLAPGDLEGIVDTLVHVRGVEVAALLHERADRVKVSLRSRGRVNVADVAQHLALTGGGHAKAAGVALAPPLSRAREQVVGSIAEALGFPDWEPA